MGTGLGRNSPVVLTLGKDNYEALIERHGQWCRWRTARKCTCIKDTMHADIHCKICGGRGWVYGYQKNKEVYAIVKSNGTKYLCVDDTYKDAALVAVYDCNNDTLEATKCEQFIYFQENLQKSEYYTVVMNTSLVKHKEAIAARFESGNEHGGYFSLDLSIRRTGVDGLYHRAQSDIVKIGKIEDADGKEYKAMCYRQNKFYLQSDEPIKQPITCYEVDYIEPTLFILLSQNLEERDEQAVLACKGDAVATFAYNLDVATGDIITALSGAYVCKDTIVKATGIDTLPCYFVDKIDSIIGNREYIEGVDFVLYGNNQILWMCKDVPATGENFSIQYKACPTYTVIKAIPQLRTSENQHIPKKVVVKLMAGYADKKGVNKQEATK